MSTVKNLETVQTVPKLDTYIKGKSNFQRSMARLRRHRMALVGAGLLILVFAFVFVGSLLIPERASTFNDPSRALQYPSSEFPFGTDVIGRDLLARTVYGGQISLFVGVTAVIVQMFVGTVIGLVAGYLGGYIDSLLMRLVRAPLSAA